MRTLTQQAVIAAYQESTESIFLPLLTIENTGLSAPIRIVNNTEQIISEGNIFEPFPFSCVLPLDDGKTLPALQVTIDNVSQEMIQLLRALQSAPTITLQVILAESPDSIELELTTMTLREIDADQYQINFTIADDDWLNALWPAHDYDITHFRGLFR